MISAGSYHTLTVSRISPHGLYLADEEGAEVLLPNRFVSLENKVGDRMEVFVYHDSEERPVATTLRPLAVVGEVAYLKVVDKTIHGAFLDWGEIPKDLFVPNRNQHEGMELGRQYIVWLYCDNVTGRAVGTTKLKSFITNEPLSVQPGDEVQVIVTQYLETGFRCVVNNRHWGMLYHNQIFRPVRIGDRLTAYVSRITPDNRIDLSLQAPGYDEVKKQAARLLEMADAAGGALALNDSTPPEHIALLAGMSKKVFKRALGYLLKQGLAELTGEGFKRK